MNETARKERNAKRLTELHSVFAQRIAVIIASLEADGFRPRIQDAWRSPEEQLKAYNSGNSKLKFGFHNVTGDDGKPESLAVDLLDDDSPLSSRSEYLLRLAAAARGVKCQTGVGWGLPLALREALAAAIARGDWTAPVKIGWDPTHVEPADITLAEVKTGARPDTPHVRAARRHGARGAPRRGSPHRAGKKRSRRAG